MEQARHWMWTKQNHGLNSHLQASRKKLSYDEDSWEEQAFAEDAAGALGGCIWPPRSYSCSFCRREFRSAQALGGHMNVHRRDRARLKLLQSPNNSHSEVLQNDHQNDHNHIPNTYTSFGFQYPSQLYTLECSPNPNSNLGVTHSPSSSSRVSTTPTQENCCEKALFPLSSYSIVEEERIWSPRTCPSSRDSRPNMAEDRYNHISDPRDIEAGEKKSRILESDCRAKKDYAKTDLSISLNLVVRRTRPTISDGEDESMGSKRRRTESGKVKSPLSLSLKSNSVDRHHVRSEVFEISHCSIEELDLELRLGDPPEVK